MAAKVDSTDIVSIKISGYDKPVVYSRLIVEQDVLQHHRFSFIWNAVGFKSDTTVQLDVLNNYVGQQVTIEFCKTNMFIGLITDIAIDDRNNASHSFVISGYSPTYLLEDAPRSGSFYKKTLEQIGKAVVQGIPANVLKTKFEPELKDKLHYIVQYNETDFQFLVRLATRYGEWFYYNGTEMMFGPAGDSKITLEKGADLDRLVIKAKLMPNKFNYSGYDYFKGEKLTDSIKPLEPAANNTFSAKTASISKDVFSRETQRPVHVPNVSNKQQLEQFKEAELRRLQSNLITIKGESKNPGLKTGSRFKIKSDGNTVEYIAISVVHISNLSGHYQNTFVGIPSTVKAPHYTNPRMIRKSGVQTALVKENHDTDGMNRIKVQFPWQQSSDVTPWIRVATPHAGGGKGMHFIPEKGEEVIVDFESEDVEKPFVVASHFHGGAKSGSGDGDNNSKSLSSRSGNKITLDDKAGSVTVVDKAGNKVFIDGSGNISVTGSESITLTSGSSSLSMKKDGSIELKGNEIKVNGTKVSVAGTEKAIIGSGQASFAAASNGDAQVGGLKTVVTGTAEVTVTGAKATFNGDATADLSSSGPTSIAGAIVKLN